MQFMINNQENLPDHVAIIPDANRRWAKERGLKPWEGHEEGAKNFEKLINHTFERGIGCLSIWGSSQDNLLKRPLDEKKALLDIYKRYFKRLLDDKKTHENEVKVNVIGRWEEQFPDSLKKVIYEVLERTKDYNKRVLNFMLAYSGTDEVIEAANRILEKYQKGTKITSEIFKENLMTSGIPAVDFVIRTGGEPHNSAGFMMWDTANAQLYFSETKFPDFDEKKYDEALADYAGRQRRFGK